MSAERKKAPARLSVDILEQVQAVRADAQEVSLRNFSGGPARRETRGLRSYFSPITSQRRAGLVALDAVKTRDVGQVRRLDPTEDDDFADLVLSIKAHGVIQPVSLTWDEGNDCFWTDYGHRRVAAAKAAGLASIPAIVSMQGESGDAPEALGAVLTQKQLIENLQRTQLPALDVAHAIKRLTGEGLTAAAVSQALGKSKSWVSKHLKLLELPQSILERVEHSDVGHEILYTVAQSTDDETEREALLAIAMEGGRPALNRALELRRAIEEGIPEPAPEGAPALLPGMERGDFSPRPGGTRARPSLQTALNRAHQAVAHLQALVDALSDPALNDVRGKAQALLLAVSKYKSLSAE